MTYLVQRQELDKTSKEIRRVQAEKEAKKFAEWQAVEYHKEIREGS